MTKRKQKQNNNQRKRQSTQDSQSSSSNSNQLDPIFGQYRALPISQEILQIITNDTIPTDAETYLAMVRHQAESSSSVMFSKENKPSITSNPISQQSIEPQEINKKDQILEEYKTTVLNQYLEQRSKLPEPGTLEIPSSFIFPENFTEWRSYFIQNPPTKAIISNIDHELNLKLIIYSSKWLNNNTPEKISQWIYALLVRLSDVLLSNEMSNLRELGQRAKKINLKGDDIVSELSRATNDFIILIISRFFGQRDLEL
ncbi:Survival of motor neuron protein-interacting protein [Wickerhamomyces ciferrii]|uniref:Survival of motor neuron protein-interacting protein n=1 Tax=Wickerhamomyces ciferrii (strain ATCC 14091 / BCRC 22168 / CBS 111 / JCM 3599 / NBRC 0793 / NRRL Y-1031 F-60-10) TaxID=1206466 RepID=K0KL67_WICCF|nr:Survival of motor neuron protein-interacting protein [Wickerhamomyces ciferrii]CCH45985.1 Survival of motor neuron protein-interacting protein [Wickerhamomyces ciferrii]